MAEGTFSVFVRCDMNGQGTMTLPGIRTTTLVRQVKQIIIDREGPMVKDVRLNFRGKPLRDEMKMSDYEIRQDSVLFMALRLYGGAQQGEGSARQFDHKRAKAKGVTPTKDNCELYIRASCDSDAVWRAKLPCGHTLCPECIFHQVQNTIMNNGHTQVKCPCSSVRAQCNNGDLNLSMLFIVAALSDEEISNFEIQLGKNYCEKYAPPCIQCKKFVDCSEENVFKADCPVCKVSFCKTCKNKWKIKSSRKHCGNDTCSGGGIIDLLENCDRKVIDAARTDGQPSPTIRLCPKCTKINEYISGCKRMTCGCAFQYCFVCLKPWSATGCGYGADKKCSPAPVQNT